MHKLLITKQNYKKESFLVALLDEKDRFVEASLYPLYCNDKPQMGTICIGKVKSIAKNLNAAFVDVAKGFTCYLELDKMDDAFFSHQARAGKLTEGDEIVVQLVKEGIKTKFPIASTKLSFAGQFLVLTNEHRKIGISSKLPVEERNRLEQFFAGYSGKDYSLIVRTNAAAATEEQLHEELKQLQQRYNELIHTYQSRTCYSILHAAKPFYQEALDNCYLEDLEEIITDEADIYHALCQQYEQNEALLQKIRFYQNDAIRLSQVYQVNTQLEKALNEKVWLKSGAYLIIQQTEALTVIDVNSGKNSSKKKIQEYYYRINAEAATEIARQLRLRNISGIIVVDFINMSLNAEQQELMQLLRAQLHKDPVPTQLIDITRLGLVEITRKKGRKSLAEQVLGTQ